MEETLAMECIDDDMIGQFHSAFAKSCGMLPRILFVFE